MNKDQAALLLSLLSGLTGKTFKGKTIYSLMVGPLETPKLTEVLDNHHIGRYEANIIILDKEDNLNIYALYLDSEQIRRHCPIETLLNEIFYSIN